MLLVKFVQTRVVVAHQDFCVIHTLRLSAYFAVTSGALASPLACTEVRQ